MTPVTTKGGNKGSYFTREENEKLVASVIRFRLKKGLRVNQKSIEKHNWIKISSEAGLLTSKGSEAVRQRWKNMQRQNQVVNFVADCHRNTFASTVPDLTRTPAPYFTHAENKRLVKAVINWRVNNCCEVNQKSIDKHDWDKITSDAGLSTSRHWKAVRDRWKKMQRKNQVVDFVDEHYREKFAAAGGDTFSDTSRSSRAQNQASHHPARSSLNVTPTPVTLADDTLNGRNYSLAEMGIKSVMRDFKRVLPYISMCTMSSLELDKYLNASNRLGGKQNWTIAVDEYMENDLDFDTAQRVLDNFDADGMQEVIDHEMKELKRVFGDPFGSSSTEQQWNETNQPNISASGSPFQASSPSELESLDEGIGSTTGSARSPQEADDASSGPRMYENLASLIQEQLDMEDQDEMESDTEEEDMNVGCFVRQKLKPSNWLCSKNDKETVPSGYQANNAARKLTENEWLKVMKAAGLKNKWFAYMTLEEWEKIRKEKLITVKTAEEIRLEFFCRVVPNLKEFSHLPFRPYVYLTEYNQFSKITIFNSMTIVSVSQLKHCIHELVKTDVLSTKNLTEDEWYSAFVRDVASSSQNDQHVRFHTTEKDFLDVKKALLKDIVKCGVDKCF